ncbi:hypothetical protein [Croceicoccus sp. YJ47]|uniref:hypothetical protein n=1 Tax=Croceicoccus sp. YJ47 TaxID=2798724 RepID=UPI001924F6A9|nr:hypothetical protein [Croceicoccus sp. YJ47]QQN74823.1 hypothetical protein JD971_03620 [Croceicoccus sp. YJ47]
MKSALPTLSAAAFGIAEPVHGMGTYHLGRSTRPVMPSADEGTCPALFQVEYFIAPFLVRLRGAANTGKSDAGGQADVSAVMAAQSDNAATFYQRRETVGNLSAGAWCPGYIEGLII